MGTTAQKLAKLAQTKSEIRAAIIAKEVQVPADATFASYSTYIGQISGGGIIPTGNIELVKQTGTDVTNYATASVKSGTVANPTATKGTVSNHSITVTPSVNKSAAGWIDSGTLTGTGVSISASELVSGNIQLTQATSTDVTNYATATVQAGTAGTPSATKGTVSNHAVSVTPKVTNSAGWISGGTLTGTAVSVSASELVSGSIQLTQATATDVTNYASATVKTGSATTPATTKQQSTPTISVNSSGLITASVAATSVSVTPIVSAGWVTSGTAGTVTMSASSATSQLSTQGAATITPTTSAQTAVAAGKYTTGAVTVAAIQTETKTVTANGTYTPTSGKYFSSVTVNVAENIYRTGSGAPSASLGNDGDVYFNID